MGEGNVLWLRFWWVKWQTRSTVLHLFARTTVSTVCDREHNAMDGEKDCAPLFQAIVNFYCYFTTLTVSHLYSVNDRMKGY